MPRGPMTLTKARKLISETMARTPTNVHFSPGRVFLRFTDDAAPRQLKPHPAFSARCWWNVDGVTYMGAITFQLTTVADRCNKLIEGSK